MPASDKDLCRLRIVAVDDEPSNLLLLRRVLERAGYTRVETTTDPSAVPAMFAEAPPDLLLLDLHMPGMDGFEVMERLAPLTAGGANVPVLVLTADVTNEVRRQALSMGARDFLTKPIDQTELLLRVRNVLQVHHLQAELRRHGETLERTVAERTRELEHARLEVLERLALAAEFRDDDTHEHAQRIGSTASRLARAMGRPKREVELIRRAAPLHDIGKIAIPDAILLKPGKLTDGEFEVMKLHTTTGAEILSGGRSAMLRMAEQIARTHHERWDGRGYPSGLSGQEIPLTGRIVSVADVFDALTHERPYKEAWPVNEAVREIHDQRGRQFDPAAVDAFLKLDPSMLLSSEERVTLRDGEPAAGPAALSRA